MARPPPATPRATPTIAHDNIYEGDEVLFVELAGGSPNVEIPPDEDMLVTILDDDPIPTITIDSIQVDEWDDVSTVANAEKR